LFKPFGGGRWLIFPDENDPGAIKKLTALSGIIYVEFVKLFEGRVIDLSFRGLAIELVACLQRLILAIRI
jgi:hypothetical protein